MILENKYPCQTINAPELANHPEFVKWANSPNHNIASWHQSGPLGEYSDIFVWKDIGTEGSNSDMPQDVWEQICNAVGHDFFGIIWIKFIGISESIAPEETTVETNGNDILENGGTIAHAIDPNTAQRIATALNARKSLAKNLAKAAYIMGEP